MTEQEMQEFSDTPTLNSNADIRKMLQSEIDTNDSIIAIHEYIGKLSNWGEDLDNLTEPQKIFYLNQIFEMEVNNGGISQYFFNSGQYAHETVNSLKAISALKTAEILQKSIDKFPKAIVPKDDDKREDILEKMEEKNDSIWDKLEDKFYEYEDDLNDLNLAYIQQHINDF